jgi:hypothetical protein
MVQTHYRKNSNRSEELTEVQCLAKFGQQLVLSLLEHLSAFSSSWRILFVAFLFRKQEERN